MAEIKRKKDLTRETVARIEKLVEAGVVDEEYLDHMAQTFEQILNLHILVADMPMEYRFQKVERDVTQ